MLNKGMKWHVEAMGYPVFTELGEDRIEILFRGTTATPEYSQVVRVLLGETIPEYLKEAYENFVVQCSSKGKRPKDMKE